MNCPHCQCLVANEHFHREEPVPIFNDLGEPVACHQQVSIYCPHCGATELTRDLWSRQIVDMQGPYTDATLIALICEKMPLGRAMQRADCDSVLIPLEAP